MKPFFHPINCGFPKNSDRNRNKATAGFTLAELIVASAILSIVMAGVYICFHSTLRTWKKGEANLAVLQNARSMMSIFTREISSHLGGTEHLVVGKKDEITFFVTSQPMNPRHGEGSRVMWVRYHFNRAGHTIVRTEALVKGPLPMASPTGEKIDEKRVKLGTKKRYEMADNVLDFEIEYYWVPQKQREDPDKPPVPVEPVIKDENKEGWGLPQGLKITMTVKDPNSEKGKTTFVTRTTFNGPSTLYDEKKVGKSI